VIYDELVKGEIREDSRQAYQHVITDLVSRGAEGVVLGCTEIPLLIHQEDVNIPILDTTRIHAEAAVDWAII
jgi:aspartate racemase